MLKQHSHSVVIFSISLFFLLPLVSIQTFATSKPDELAVTSMDEHTVSLSLQNIALRIDQRIANMKILANTIANDAHIHDWIDKGSPTALEDTLLEKLTYIVNQYELTSASFADTQTHKYWNHEGFLRILEPKTDTWYFNYLASNKQDLISVYHDKNKKRVDLYVNYRQSNGLGLSGIATSFDSVVTMLNHSALSQDGEVFIVDDLGVIQIHSDLSIAGNRSLQSEFGSTIASGLLVSKPINIVRSKGSKSVFIASAFVPSMNWFVVFQAKHKAIQ